MTSMPVVAIVGRPNVGKSSLLNALVGKRISIVQDEPGVTRDRVSTPWDIDGRYVELVDTGGYGFIDPDQLTDHIRQQIELAMGRANLILFLVDAQSGLTAGDQEVATLLRKLNVKTVLVANKDDGTRTDVMLADFARLGLGTPIGVSAMNGRNLDQLRDLIVSSIDLSAAPTTIAAPAMMLAIVGKRNAGKSTLVNSVVEIYTGDPNRVIVSEVPGTTRDSIDVRVEKDGQSLIVIDTAGVRKKRHMVTNDIEFYSFHRAQRSVRRSDVVLLLIDATEPVSEPDKKLAQYITEQYKPVVLVVNKWDKAKEIMREQRRSGGEDVDDRELMAQYREYLNQEMPYLDYAPISFVTAKDGKNVQTVLDTAQHLFNQSRERVTTGRLNAAIRSILDERSPTTASGRRARIYYATQVETAPPTIVLVVNKVAYIDEPYQRFVINRMRELLPYPEVPIRLIIRPRTTATPEGVTPISQTDRPAKKPSTPASQRAKPGKSKTPSKAPAKRRGRK